MEQREDIERRVYDRELEQLTGWGPTWIRTLERRGVIPKARTDPGGKRRWRPLSEAKAIVEGRTADAAKEVA